MYHHSSWCLYLQVGKRSKIIDIENALKLANADGVVTYEEIRQNLKKWDVHFHFSIFDLLLDLFIIQVQLLRDGDWNVLCKVWHGWRWSFQVTKKCKTRQKFVFSAGRKGLKLLKIWRMTRLIRWKVLIQFIIAKIHQDYQHLTFAISFWK